jgi:hypothetical protein
LRRSASGSTPNSTTHSLPIAKRKTLLNSFSCSSSSAYSSYSPPTLSHMDMTRRLHEGQWLLLPDTRNNEREKFFFK